MMRKSHFFKILSLAAYPLNAVSMTAILLLSTLILITPLSDASDVRVFLNICIGIGFLRYVSSLMSHTIQKPKLSPSFGEFWFYGHWSMFFFLGSLLVSQWLFSQALFQFYSDEFIPVVAMTASIFIATTMVGSALYHKTIWAAFSLKGLANTLRYTGWRLLSPWLLVGAMAVFFGLATTVLYTVFSPATSWLSSLIIGFYGLTLFTVNWVKSFDRCKRPAIKTELTLETLTPIKAPVYQTSTQTGSIALRLVPLEEEPTVEIEQIVQVAEDTIESVQTNQAIDDTIESEQMIPATENTVESIQTVETQDTVTAEAPTVTEDVPVAEKAVEVEASVETVNTVETTVSVDTSPELVSEEIDKSTESIESNRQKNTETLMSEVALSVKSNTNLNNTSTLDTAETIHALFRTSLLISKQGPSFVEQIMTLAKRYQDEGQAKKALATLRYGVSKLPTHHGLLKATIQVAMQLRAFKEIQTYGRLAIAELTRGKQIANALILYQMITQYYPEFHLQSPKIVRPLADACFQSEKWGLLIHLVDQLHKRTNPHDDIGWCYLWLAQAFDVAHGDKAKAKQVLDYLLVHYPHHPAMTVIEHYWRQLKADLAAMPNNRQQSA